MKDVDANDTEMMKDVSETVERSKEVFQDEDLSVLPGTAKKTKRKKSAQKCCGKTMDGISERTHTHKGVHQLTTKVCARRLLANIE